jgi:ABC-type antimicrobial peptide transport system permease subunit
LYQIIATKKASSSILYVFLLAIALLAIFDTQVLSIFRRQKEIGTYISLGMTRQQVVKLFTVEGAMYSILAAGVALIIGAPILLSIAKVGIPIPEASRSAGVAMSAKIYPVYGFILLITTFILVVLAATIVSYMPARKISKMDPVNALKGKIQ